MEEGGWYLHNAMRHEGVLYHPECHKDMEKVGQVDTSFNTTIEAINTTKKEVDGLEEQYGEILGKDKEDYVDPDVNVEAAANDTEKVASLVKNMETEPLSLVADGAESGANSLSAPVVAQPKVVMILLLLLKAIIMHFEAFIAFSKIINHKMTHHSYNRHVLYKVWLILKSSC